MDTNSIWPKLIYRCRNISDACASLDIHEHGIHNYPIGVFSIIYLSDVNVASTVVGAGLTNNEIPREQAL